MVYVELLFLILAVLELGCNWEMNETGSAQSNHPFQKIPTSTGLQHYLTDALSQESSYMHSTNTVILSSFQNYINL